MPTTFPTSLDAFPNPGAATLEDAAGFYHDEQHANANDAIEAIQAKLGISEAAAQDAPLANMVLASSTNGRSKWRALTAADIATGGALTRIALSYTASTDLYTTTAVTANVAYPVPLTPQSFSLDLATSIIQVAWRGFASLGGMAADGQAYIQVFIDGGFFGKFGGEGHTATKYANPFAGGGSCFFSGLAAGSHTIVLHIVPTLAATLSLRASGSATPAENFSFQVIEHKR